MVATRCPHCGYTTWAWTFLSFVCPWADWHH